MNPKIVWSATMQETNTFPGAFVYSKTGGSTEVVGYHTQELPDGEKLTYRMFSDGRVELISITYTECGDDEFCEKDNENGKNPDGVKTTRMTLDGKKYGHPEKKAIPGVDRVIFSPPATTVFWDDSTKTIVKCTDGDKFDEKTGFCIAFAKKVLGNGRVRCIVKNAYRQPPKVKKQKDEDNVYRNLGAALDDILDPMSGLTFNTGKDVDNV